MLNPAEKKVPNYEAVVFNSKLFWIAHLYVVQEIRTERRTKHIYLVFFSIISVKQGWYSGFCWLMERYGILNIWRQCDRKLHIMILPYYYDYFVLFPITSVSSFQQCNTVLILEEHKEAHQVSIIMTNPKLSCLHPY